MVSYVFHILHLKALCEYFQAAYELIACRHMHQLTYSRSVILEWGSFILLQSVLICSGISWEMEYKQGCFTFCLLFFSNNNKESQTST